MANLNSVNNVNGLGDLVGLTDSSLRQAESYRSLSENGEYIIDISPTYYSSNALANVGTLANYTGEWNFKIKSPQIITLDSTTEFSYTGDKYLLFSFIGEAGKYANLSVDLGSTDASAFPIQLGGLAEATAGLGFVWQPPFEMTHSNSYPFAVEILGGATIGENMAVGLTLVEEPQTINKNTEVSSNINGLGDIHLYSFNTSESVTADFMIYHPNTSSLNANAALQIYGPLENGLGNVGRNYFWHEVL